MGWLSRAFGGGRRAPRDVDGAMRSALLAVLAHDLEEAERLLTAAVKLDPRNVEPYVALARVFRNQGEIGRAIRLHQNVLLRAELGPGQQVDALLDLAADLEAGGFVQRAIASYEEALGRLATQLSRRGVAAWSVTELFRFAAREGLGRPSAAAIRGCAGLRARNGAARWLAPRRPGRRLERRPWSAPSSGCRWWWAIACSRCRTRSPSSWSGFRTSPSST